MSDKYFREKLLKFLYYEKYPHYATPSELSDFFAKEDAEKDLVERNLNYLLEKGFIERNWDGSLRISVDGVDFLEVLQEERV